MKLLTYLGITFLVAFVLQYYIISFVITHHRDYVYNTYGKMYISLFAASIMGILEVIIYDAYQNTVSVFYYIGLGLLIYISALFYKRQYSVDEADYIKQMLEASSRDLLLSNNLIYHTNNININTVATNIIDRRNRDIHVMRKLLSDIENKQQLPITKSDAFAYQKLL